MSTTIEHDDTQTIHHNRTITVDGTHTETIKKDTKISITEGNLDYYVKGVVTEKFDNRQETTVKGNIDLTSKEGDIKQTAKAGVFFIEGAKEVKITSTEDVVNVYADKQILLHVGQSTLLMKKDGTIRLEGVVLEVVGKTSLTTDAPTTKVQGNSVQILGKADALLGVDGQTVKCDTAKVTVSGAAITSAAQGNHEITGALVKIN